MTAGSLARCAAMHACPGLAEKRKAAKEQKEAEEAAQKKEVDSIIEADKDGVVEAIDMDELEEEEPGVVPLCSIT